MEVQIMIRRWQNIVNMLLSVWLFISPWTMHYTHQAAAWNAWTFGIATFAFALSTMFVPRMWEEAINMLLGLWLVVSPYALQFASESAIAINTVAVGVLLVAFAYWAFYNDEESRIKRLREHRGA
jgi:hypothetical protein